MNLIEEILSLKSKLENESLCYCCIDFRFDGNEIYLNLHITLGLDTVDDIYKNFNSCDYETNKKSCEDFINNFNYDKYMNL